MTFEIHPLPTDPPACPYCKASIGESAGTRTCRKCGTHHHSACWRIYGGCSVFGCEEPEPERNRPRSLFMAVPAIVVLFSMVHRSIAAALSFLLIPAVLFCLCSGTYYLLALIEKGLLRESLSGREIRHHIFYTLWNLVPILIGLFLFYFD